MLIRKAKRSDIEKLSELEWQLLSAQVGHDPQYYKLVSRRTAMAMIRTDMQGLVNDKNTIQLVAVEDGRVVGALIAQTAWKPSVFPRQQYIILGDTVVDLKYRRRGVYRRLQKALERLARNMKAVHIELCVDVSNTVAMQAYERLGFTIRQVKMVKKLK